MDGRGIDGGGGALAQDLDPAIHDSSGKCRVGTRMQYENLMMSDPGASGSLWVAPVPGGLRGTTLHRVGLGFG